MRGTLRTRGERLDDGRFSPISYPPANLNRDDLGQPKTARLGGVERLRVSSQSLKRAWRTSELFQQQLAGSIGTRTKRLGREAFDALVKAGVSEKQATEWAGQIAKVYGAVKKDNPLEIEQLVHIAPEERDSLDTLVAILAQEKRAPSEKELDALLHKQSAVDIAMFGRMLASKTAHNGEAAVQVAHAIGVHASAIEDDYFTAVDEPAPAGMNRPQRYLWWAHVGVPRASGDEPGSWARPSPTRWCSPRQRG